jgi:cytochrome c551/c552
MSTARTRIWFIPAILGLLFAGSANRALQSRTLAAQGADASLSRQQALLNQYCITCHNKQVRTGGLSLDTLSLAEVGRDTEIWERVVRKVRTGMMPPSGARRPDRAALDAFALDLENRLDRHAASNPNPGFPSLHRLNRTEYRNAIRDLLDLDEDVASLLPADDSSEGFDNIADALGVSPSLIQGYVSAAMKISRKAVGDRTLVPSQVTYAAPTGLVQDRHVEGLPLGTRGGMLVRHTFPLDGEYQISTGGGRGGGGGADITLDGQRIPRTQRFPVQAGPHTIGVSVIETRRAGGVDDQYSDFRNNSAFGVGGGVSSVVITGPFNPAGAGETPSRRRIFVCYPESAADEPSCARKILSNLARRAFRRPLLDDAEVDGLMRFYQEGRNAGDFETGIQYALARILVAPRFVYRMEDEPAGVKDGAVYRVSDLALASRLSFFIWSSIPDEELLEVARQGRLNNPAVLEQQVRRMLKDPKSEALIKNFSGQWLYLRSLDAVTPDSKDFDENLRQAMRRETEMLFESIAREEQSLVRLLDANYTFVNERLARHYGIAGIRGDYFRRVTLPQDSPRRGLLGQASVLTLTSIANRTSPVSRGKWILQNILGAPPPEPPPGVETNLEPDPKALKVTSLRERMELHRTNPVCASCHSLMDPIGFSLENFDLVGKWRDKDGATLIDPSGTLVDGSTVKGPSDLRNALLDRSDAFVTSATERLMTYALGRVVDHHDMPAVRAVVRGSAQNDYRFSALVLEIVRSAPFQMKIKKPAGEASPRAE